jgi:glycosyl transferase, family 25
MNSDCWRIFVISLKDATDRRESIARQLKALSLDFDFLDAIDGRDGLAEPFEDWIDRQATRTRLGRDMSDGEYACAISHMIIYKRIIEKKLPGAIILEDDAVLTPQFRDFLAYGVFKSAPLIQLDHRNARVFRFARGKRFEGALTIKRAAFNPELTTAYSISLEAARFMVANGLPITGTADWPCDVTRIPCWITLPRLARQLDVAVSESSLDAGRKRMKKASKEHVRAVTALGNSSLWFLARLFYSRVS